MMKTSRDMSLQQKMLLSIVLLSLVPSSGGFQCRELNPCSCFMESDDSKVLDCSFKSMGIVPDFTQLSSKLETTEAWLQNNYIEQIPSTAFVNLAVEKLDLGDNPLLNIQDDRGEIFLPLRKTLKSLHLRHVRGINLNKRLSFLQDLEQLEDLDLSTNVPLEGSITISEPIFEGLNLKSLKNLIMRSCKISDIQKGAFSGLKKLETLDLTMNSFMVVPAGILDLTNLKTLQMGVNGVKRIHNKAFSTLASINEIILSENKITKIDDEAFKGIMHNTSLELILNQNNLAMFPAVAFNDFKSLHSLSCSDCGIKIIPDDSFRGAGIKELTLDRNPIDWTKSAGAFNGLEESLQSLSLKSMELTSLPNDALRRQEKLNVIKAQYNDIEMLGDGFFDGIKTHRLDLSSNKINGGTPDLFRGVRKPMALILNSNNISDITFLSNADDCRMRRLDLRRNPVKCTCELEKLITSGAVGNAEGVCLSGTDKKSHYFRTDTVPEYLVKMCGKNNSTMVCDWENISSTTSITYSVAVYLLPLLVAQVAAILF